MASEALNTALDKASDKVGNKLGIPNLSKIIPDEKVLKMLREEYLEGNTITEVITKLQPYYEEQDDSKVELRKELKKRPKEQNKIDKLKEQIEKNEREIDNKINQIKNFFIKLPADAQSNDSEIISILHYYQIEKQKFDEVTKKILGQIGKMLIILWQEGLLVNIEQQSLIRRNNLMNLNLYGITEKQVRANETIEKLNTSLKKHDGYKGWP